MLLTTTSLCLKLFSEDSDSLVLEATQSSIRATQVGSPPLGTPSKRRRVELGWEVLRDHLQPQNNDFDVIPWYEKQEETVFLVPNAGTPEGTLPEFFGFISRVHLVKSP